MITVVHQLIVGDCIIEAETLDNDDGSAFIEMVILNKYGKVLYKWYEE